MRKVSVFTGRGGADFSQAAFSSPSQRGELSSSALVVPVSIFAIDALLELPLLLCNSREISVFLSMKLPQNFPRTPCRPFLGNTSMLMEVYNLSASLRYLEFFPSPALFPTHLFKLMCRIEAGLCHCCVTGGCSGHVLQLQLCFLRRDKDTKLSANKKSHCLRSWSTGRCSSLCLLGISEFDLALLSALSPCDGVPARIFSFTRRLSFPLFYLGGSCWNTAGMVAPQILQEPSSLSPSLRFMCVWTPV